MEIKDSNIKKIYTCIICKIDFTKKNNDINDNKKYLKYNKKICASCFKDYYP